MADLTRAEELVRTMERDAEFQAAVQAAPTMTAKRQVLDSHGFRDIDLEDMKAYVESKGGTLNIPEGGKELSEQELAAVAGGLTDDEQGWIITGAAVGGITVAAVAASAAAV